MAKKENSFVGEFKKFILRGNVIDMAVGIAVGGAFTAIVNSFVADIINPILGFILGDMDFSDLKVVLKPAAEGAEEVAIRYGMLIQKIVIFLITAFALFLVIRVINRLHDLTDKNDNKEPEEK